MDKANVIGTTLSAIILLCFVVGLVNIIHLVGLIVHYITKAMKQATYNRTRDKLKKRYDRETRPQQKAKIWASIEALKSSYEKSKAKKP